MGEGNKPTHSWSQRAGSGVRGGGAGHGLKPLATLLFFSSNPQLREVSRSLADCGYRVRAIHYRDWDGQCAKNEQHVLVVLIDEVALSSCEVSDPTALGVIHLGLIQKSVHLPEPGRHSSDLLHVCNELAIWPCSRQELTLRLERLRHAEFASAAGAELDPALRGFARLNLIGASPAFSECLRTIERLAQFDAPVLIEGETGTGKELAARALHCLSGRRDGPFIPVNCAAIPDSLLGNELFGHERGAFTDAKSRFRGLIAQAEGGTLFLDEVNSFSPGAQATLLRFLEDKQYQPLGSARRVRGQVAIMSATNISLQDAVRNGSFRQDLYFRLNVTRVKLPPLRERRDDIPLLVEHFLLVFGSQYGQAPKTLHPESMNWLRERAWPGNVRELENLVHHEFLTSDGAVIHIDPSGYARERAPFTPETSKDDLLSTPFDRARRQVLHEFERNYLDSLMQCTGGNVSEAARFTGKERRTLGRLLKKHGISRHYYLKHS